MLSCGVSSIAGYSEVLDDLAGACNRVQVPIKPPALPFPVIAAIKTTPRPLETHKMVAHNTPSNWQYFTWLANEQGGYFTAKQAKQVGYGYKHLDYHETAGNFERVSHGLCRLPTIPRVNTTN